MDKLFIQYLLIEKKLKLVQWHEIFAMVGSKYFQVLNYTENVAQDFYNFTKVVKFRQNWFHCSLRQQIENCLLIVKLFPAASVQESGHGRRGLDRV